MSATSARLRFMETIEYYRKRRRVAIVALGGRCQWCGATEPLQFDHINPATKSINLGADWHNSGWWEEVLTKCQLLCAYCHTQKSATEARVRMLARGFTHGTVYGWMKKRCPCMECQLAKREWNDNRNAARRAQVVK